MFCRIFGGDGISLASCFESSFILLFAVRVINRQNFMLCHYFFPVKAIVQFINSLNMLS